MLMDVRNYLRRIGIDELVEPNGASLARLQRQHLQTVPFENLDIQRGAKVVLDLEFLYDKIVTRARGGFCYELNGLFAWLLTQLGYDVARVSARAYNTDKGGFGPEFDHMALLVNDATTYLVDVGFGDSVRTPMALPDGEARDVSGGYRIRAPLNAPGRYVLERHDSGRRTPRFSFSTQARRLTEFEGMCHYHQTSADSHFTQRLICTMAMETGRISLSKESLTITTKGVKRKLACASDEERQRLLRECFGIRAEEVVGLT